MFGKDRHGDGVACFNTGLATPKQDEIYAYFTEARRSIQVHASFHLVQGKGRRKVSHKTKSLHAALFLWRATAGGRTGHDSRSTPAQDRDQVPDLFVHLEWGVDGVGYHFP